MPDNLVVVHGGLVEQAGKPLEVFSQPRRHTSPAFLGNMNVRSDNGIKRLPDALIKAGAGTIGIRPEYLWIEPDPRWVEMG